MPLPSLFSRDCSHKCTVTSGCILALWDGTTSDSTGSCWLKSSATFPSGTKSLFMLLPVGMNGCPASYTNTAKCLATLLNFNLIPGFDFSNNNIIKSSKPLLDCSSDDACVGYNSAGELKNDFQNPIKNATQKFYVSPVQFGMYFVQSH